MVQSNVLNFEAGDLDTLIYRIMPEAYVIKLFRNRENVLSRVHKWKDKFEGFQVALAGKDAINAFVGQCWTTHALSEAMWGIYASDANKRFLRIRSTPRRLLRALELAHPDKPRETCFLGKVRYERVDWLKAHFGSGRWAPASPADHATPLFIKRRAFKHENEVRLMHRCNADDCDENSLYRYPVDPHAMITQIMADPSRDRSVWAKDKARLKKETGFAGEIKRSKIYDRPDWV